MAKNNSKIEYTFQNIFRGSESASLRLPLVIIDSGEKGPTVWLTACIHGDEVGGIIVTQEMTKLLKKQLQKGKIYIFPLMNPTGFESVSRNVAISGEDLNRAFPGSETGSVASRIAHQIFSTIIDTKPDLVLDLHNDWSRSIPLVFIDEDPGEEFKKSYDKTKKIAKLSGFVNILDTENFKNTLTYNLLKNNIPALTIELGESYVVNEQNVAMGIKSVWNILSSLGMLKNKKKFLYKLPEKVANKTLIYSDKPFSSSSGIVRFYHKPGEMVKKGEIMGAIFDVLGNEQQKIIALDNGIVLGTTDFAAVFPGSVIMAFGNINRKK